MSETEKLDINTAHGLDQFLISCTFFLRIRFCAVRYIGISRINIHAVKQMLMHEIIVTLIIVACQPFILVQIHRLYFREFNKLIISSDRCRTCCQSQNTVRL